MMGRKLEEDDWNRVYCGAKGIPLRGWSNLNIDVIHEGLGVEQKMVGVDPKKSIKECCGLTLMHPAATRSIRIPNERDATKAARTILAQYAELIRRRTEFVKRETSGKSADMRTGWLLWQRAKLEEFLYFETRMEAPNPSDYYAQWHATKAGERKPSENLWVYESSTGKKRYSITTVAGAKIQPYFDVPAPNDPNLYCFRVQGEPLDSGEVRLWVTRTTALFLSQLFGDLTSSRLERAIVEAANHVERLSKTPAKPMADVDVATPLVIARAAYDKLVVAFPGVSDEHRIQLLIGHFAAKHEG